MYSISIEYKTAATARRGLSLEWETLGPYPNSRKEASDQMPYQDYAASSRLAHSGHSEFPFPAFSERGGQGEIIGVEGEKSHVSVPLEVIGPAFYHLPQIFFCMCRPSASQAASDRRASAASHAKLRSLPVEQARLESERSPT